jgi:hypothetical protein
MRFGEKSISPALLKRKQAELQTELDAAHESLAETELHLTIDRQQLELALELVEDVQAIYVAADEQTRRGYNQAFFKKLYALAESDDNRAGTRARIEGAELTEPYALLLTEGLFEQVEAEAQSIQTGPPTRNRARSADRSTSPVSIYEQMAEREGFEPSNEVAPVTRFPVAPVQPLRHLSRRTRRYGGHPPDQATERAAALRLRHGRSLRC